MICSCTNDATPMILFRFRRVATHFEIYAKSDYSIHSDPPNLYSSIDDREGLCNAVINAKQFAQEHKSRKTSFLTDLTKSHRLSPKSRKLGLQIEECALKQRWGLTTVKCLECVRIKRLRLFVALGQPNKFMYLLQRSVSKQDIYYRMIGLLEPTSAIAKNDQSFAYFHNQIQVDRFKMESIICNLGTEDQVRICGEVFVALNGENMPSVNYLPDQKSCILTVVKEQEFLAEANVLRCNLADEPSNTLLIDQFFVLPDLRERATVFVFLSTGEQVKRLPVLKLHARAAEVSALLTPLKPEKRQVVKGSRSEKQKRRMHQPLTNREDNEECTTSKTKRKVNKNKTDTDSIKASKDNKQGRESDSGISFKSARSKKTKKEEDLMADTDSSVSKSFECEKVHDTNLTDNDEEFEEEYNSMYNEEENAEQDDEEEEEETVPRKKKKGVRK